MEKAPQQILAQLYALQDLDYRAFHLRLIPTVSPQRVLGVRIPALRAMARQLAGSQEANVFLSCLPHRYYEEDNLHVLLLERERDFSAALMGVEAFLPCIDNWATCDLPSPRIFARHKEELLPYVRRWMASDQTYTVRYGLGQLQRYYLEEAFSPEMLAWAADISSQEYYVRMMQAWYFATALAKQPQATLPWLEQPGRMEEWTRQKAIQKSRESRRISPELKARLQGCS